MIRKEYHRKTPERHFSPAVFIPILDRYGNVLQTVNAVSQAEGTYQLGKYMRSELATLMHVSPFFLEPYQGKKNMSVSVPVAPDNSQRQHYLRWEVPTEASLALQRGKRLLVIPQENAYDTWAQLVSVHDGEIITASEKPLAEIHIDRQRQRISCNDWLGAEKAILFRILSGEIVDLSQFVAFSGIVEKERMRAYVGNEIRLMVFPTENAAAAAGDEIRFVPKSNGSRTIVTGYLQNEQYCVISEPVTRYRVKQLESGKRKLELWNKVDDVYRMEEWSRGHIPIEETDPIAAQAVGGRYVKPMLGKERTLRFDLHEINLTSDDNLVYVARHDPYHLYEWLSIESNSHVFTTLRKITNDTGETYLQGRWQGYAQQSWHDFYLQTGTEAHPRTADQIYPQTGIRLPKGNKLRVFSGQHAKYYLYLTQNLPLDPLKTYDIKPVVSTQERLQAALYESGSSELITTLSIHTEKTNYDRRNKHEAYPDILQGLLAGAEQNELFSGDYSL